MSNDLLTFLQARVDEDEVQALRRARATRQLIALLEEYQGMAATEADEALRLSYRNQALGITRGLRALASVHAGHPDYREAWPTD